MARAPGVGKERWVIVPTGGGPRLTPEEDVVEELDEDAIDDLMPGDLWFQVPGFRFRRGQGCG